MKFTRSEIIERLKVYFDIRELVCPHTYKEFGERAWNFYRTEHLHTILFLREDLFKKPMICNNYHRGGRFDERGNRCNMCPIVKVKQKAYLSPHCSFAGNDFDVIGYTAQEARDKIIESESLLPYPVRIEDKVNWLHIDCYDENKGKVYIFNT